MNPTDALLAERAKTHGDFGEHASITQQLKTRMFATSNWADLSCIQKEALEMIAHKIGRILAGDPNERDHWDDIAGYARLVSQRLAPPSGEPFAAEGNKYTNSPNTTPIIYGARADDVLKERLKAQGLDMDGKPYHPD